MNSQITIKHHFGKLQDPRIKRHRKHELIDIIVIALCAVVSGAQDWQKIASFGRERREWLGRFLDLKNGTPSHDTFERVFDRIDPRAFHRCFQSWVGALAAKLKIKHIAIDGKTLRGSSSEKLGALHLVSAWATEHHLTLGQVATAEKSNEITAIPELLELLDIHGAIVTIDAMGCQKTIAKKIVDGGGDYILTAKKNQPNLVFDIQALFQKLFEESGKGFRFDEYSTYDKGHGREERRNYTVLYEPEGIRNQDEWANLKAVGMCTRERIVGNGEPSEEVCFFIGSRDMSAKAYGNTLRHHWGIENNCHWQLDVSFAEDDNRVATRNGAENLAMLRRLALMLLKRHPSKDSIATKQYTCALTPSFLEEVLVANVNSGKL